MNGVNAFQDAIKRLNGNSSLKAKSKDANNVQTSMMIDKDAKRAFRVNGEGSFSAYVNDLVYMDMRKKGWL